MSVGSYLSSYFTGGRTPDQQEVYDQYNDIYRRAGTPTTVKMGGREMPFNRWHTQLAATQGQGSQQNQAGSLMDKLVQYYLASNLMGQMNPQKGGQAGNGFWDKFMEKLFSQNSQATPTPVPAGATPTPDMGGDISPYQTPQMSGAGPLDQLLAGFSGSGGMDYGDFTPTATEGITGGAGDAVVDPALDADLWNSMYG
jgi:hypothetical protein